VRYKVPFCLLSRTFDHFRRCGEGRRECQALWTSAWQSPQAITDVVHPLHRANAGGFSLDSAWLNAFWMHLADNGTGVRVQVHTHPGEAFHSSTDDAFPIVHTPGFLSLVIPNFAMGPIGFKEAYLAEIANDGRWLEILCEERLEIT
jgi:hypothetical protein